MGAVLAPASVLAGDGSFPIIAVLLSLWPQSVWYHVLRFRFQEEEQGEGDSDIWSDRRRKEQTRIGTGEASERRNYQCGLGSGKAPRVLLLSFYLIVLCLVAEKEREEKWERNCVLCC